MRKILFVCVENSCRSQMAEGFAKSLGKNIIEPYSAGSRPSGEINPMAIEAMKEVGIDISHQVSKGFTNLTVKEFDYAVTLGCKDACPFMPAEKHLDWQISDPKNKSLEFFRETRDEIKRKIQKLIEDIRKIN